MIKLANVTRSEVSQHLRHVLCTIALGMFMGVSVFILGRIVFILSFAMVPFSSLSSQEWGEFLSVALRFDIKASGYCFIPSAVIALLCFRRGFITLYNVTFPIINILAFTWMLIMTVVNHFYYLTYDRIIDVFIFAPFKEDPAAVFETIVRDYPLVTGLILITAAVVLYTFVFHKLQKFFEKRIRLPSGKICLSVTAFLMLALFVISLRGSFTTFPIRQINAQVSDKPQVNSAVPNGPTAFYWAYKWNKTQSKIPVATASDVVKAYENLGIVTDETHLYEPLVVTTAHNDYLAEHKPDIVFAVMESMSAHMLREDEPKERDLYGALRKYVENDFYFKNFISEGNGTSDSLTRFITGVPDMNLSTSLYADKNYILNSLKPFKDAGYYCIFITGGQGSWRGLDSFLRMQGFDEVLERMSVRELFPNATEGTWGIDDEYVFGTALEVLKRKHDKPLLIFTLSITNHPPYRVPGDYEPKRIALDEKGARRFNYEGSEETFATLYYANDQLGKMIDRIEADETLKDKTFVAITGDHNRRGIGYGNYPQEELLGYAVPFILHIPEVYRHNDPSLSYNRERFGSHKDIMRTISEHALSDARLHSIGCDLLSDKECFFPYPYNADMVVSADGTRGCALFDSHVVKIGEDLLVSPDDGNYDCQKPRALAALEHTLYHYQAHLKSENAK